MKIGKKIEFPINFVWELVTYKTSCLVDDKLWYVVNELITDNVVKVYILRITVSNSSSLKIVTI